jgi:putative Mg2+ transporter-C (MgtC) family protein
MDLWSSSWLAQFQVLAQVAIAVGLGGLVGLEREIANRPAGFRTHMLIAGASALLVGLSDALLGQFTLERYGEILRSDPIRIVEAVITAVGFLGAGTIFRKGSSSPEGIEGLTTAASLLLAAGIGIAVAVGQILVAVGVSGLTLFILAGIRKIETMVLARKSVG